MSSKADVEELEKLDKSIEQAKLDFQALLSEQHLSLSEFYLQKMNSEITLDYPIFACPIASTYFLKFLETEFNTENMLCAIELKTMIFTLTRLKEECETNESVVESQLRKMLVKLRNVWDVFVSDTAAREVNLPILPKKQFISSLQSLSDFCENKDKNTVQAKQQLTLLQVLDPLLQSLTLVLEEVKKNLQDPLGRYRHSEFCFEICATMFSGKIDLLLEREKIMSNKNNTNLSNVLNDMVLEGMDKDIHPNSAIQNIMTLLSLLGKQENWINLNGKVVFNFEHFRKSSLWTSFQQLVATLSHVDLSLLNTTDQKLHFWIHLYNIMYIHLVMTMERVPGSTLSKFQFMKLYKYNVAGLPFSLDDIAYGILRNNQCVFPNGKRFKKGDPRLAHVISTPSKFVAFRLIDLTVGTPNFIFMKNAENMESQLREAYTEFLDTNAKITDQGIVLLPSLIKDNAKDYCANEKLQFIAAFVSDHWHTNDTQKIELIKRGKLAFAPKNWKLDMSLLISKERAKELEGLLIPKQAEQEGLKPQKMELRSCKEMGERRRTEIQMVAEATKKKRRCVIM